MERLDRALMRNQQRAVILQGAEPLAHRDDDQALPRSRLLAAGLAASLSETDDGKVLLVDVKLGPEEVHPFFRGKPAYPLNKALKPSDSIASAADNLYLATVGSPNSGGPAQLVLKRFFDMMPNMKASDFDYIIFDMPPLDQTSPTWGMAAFMDKRDPTFTGR